MVLLKTSITPHNFQVNLPSESEKIKYPKLDLYNHILIRSTSSHNFLICTIFLIKEVQLINYMYQVLVNTNQNAQSLFHSFPLLAALTPANSLGVIHQYSSSDPFPGKMADSPSVQSDRQFEFDSPAPKKVENRLPHSCSFFYENNFNVFELFNSYCSNNVHSVYVRCRLKQSDHWIVLISTK